jgi:predicted dehydrogenase
MRQIARRLRDGRLELLDVPEPALAPGRLLIRNAVSVISTGTERSTLEVARMGLVAKARARPDQARQVIDRVRREGLRSTLALVRQRLDELGPLGYSVAGTVLAAGTEVEGFRPGDRVAGAGAGFANHAEVNSVPALLCARVPESVRSDDAAFATLGAIALHGFRRCDVQIGSRIAVVGLGLIGQLAVQIARAAGCRVLAIDIDPDRLEVARSAGAEPMLRSDLAGGEPRWGPADAVLICASTDSSDPIELAAELARDRAPVVVVGDVGMSVPRAPYYRKELDIRLSRSYGPGRYDDEYEVHGHDYPIGYVRWTERRNMEAFLELVAEERVWPSSLLSARYPLAEAEHAFDALVSDDALAIALDFEAGPRGGRTVVEKGSDADSRSRGQARRRAEVRRAKPSFGMIGAGRFATATIIPGLIEAGFDPALIASSSGLSAADVGRRYGFPSIAESSEEVIGSDVDLVVVATPHDSHASLTAAALTAGKTVYCEKPLALDIEGLREIGGAQERTGAPLMVGFNRRHSPVAGKLRELGHPRLMAFHVNAGPLPRDSWINDPRRGGGRLLGEGCHFVDFLCDQAGADPRWVTAHGFVSQEGMPLASTDNFSIQIGFADGSAGTVHYAADAPRGPGKERIEVTAPGAYAEVHDFRGATLWRGGDRRSIGSRRQDKGHAAQFARLAAVARGDDEAPDFQSYMISTLATVAALRSLESGRAETVVAEPERISSNSAARERPEPPETQGDDREQEPAADGVDRD